MIFSLANKYRPKRFDQVVGQESEVEVLKTILSKGWKPSALLFTGSFGTGKTSMARLMARALLCECRDGVDPCGVCSSCLAMDGDNHPCYVEKDAASEGLIQDVRAMKEDILYKSVGKMKILYFDECLAGRTRILMEGGERIPISELVRDKSSKRVVSYNHSTGLLELKRILRFKERPVRTDLRKVFFKDSFEGTRCVILTPNHQVWCEDSSSYVSVERLEVSSKVRIRNPFALSEVQEQVIRGSLLGDSYLHTIPSGLSRFIFMQSDRQRDYFSWKQVLFVRLCRNQNPEKQVNSGFGDFIWRNQTIALWELTEKFKKTLYGGVFDTEKRPSKEYLDGLSPLGLAVWFMDDGHRASYHLTLSTHGFEEKDVRIIAAWFKERWGVEWEVKEDKRGKGFYLYSSKDKDKFLEIISPYLIDSMQYKGLPDRQRIEVMDDGGPGTSVTEVEEIELLDWGAATYDLEIEDNHNFFAENWLVSNSHMLSTPAQNAMLQVLEEGVKDVMFMFATTETNKMLPTIRSRCVELNMKLLMANQIAGRMIQVCEKEGISFEDKALRVVATYVRGHMRDALVLLEQLSKLSEVVTEAAARTYLRMDKYVDIYTFLTITDKKQAYLKLEELLCNYAPADLVELLGSSLLNAFKVTLGLADDLSQVDVGWLTRIAEIHGDRLLDRAERILVLDTDFSTINYGQAAVMNVIYGGSTSRGVENLETPLLNRPATLLMRKPGKPLQ